MSSAASRKRASAPQPVPSRAAMKQARYRHRLFRTGEKFLRFRAPEAIEDFLRDVEVLTAVEPDRPELVAAVERFFDLVLSDPELARGVALLILNHIHHGNGE